jgi:hypothetical protein
MIPEYPKIKLLGSEDLDELKKFIKLSHTAICELNLTNFFIWRDFDKTQLTIINGNLCILVSPPNETQYFLEPLGNNKFQETVETCLRQTNKMSRTSEPFISKLKQDNYRITPLRDQFDYTYSVRKIAELKGKKFDGKRNHIKKFKMRHPDYKFVPLKPELKENAMSLFERWFESRKQSRFFPKLAYDSQKKAVSEAFTNFEKLKLLGGALFIDNSLKGFTLGSKLNRETVSVHLQYGDPAIQGTAQVLLWEACNKVYSHFKYANLEQDLGIPGLRKSKLSWQPIKLERKFQIEPKVTS